jgi:hypothetical protein
MTKTSAASNGSTASEPDKPEYGLMVLREKETRGLISLACDAMSQTHSVVHDLHQALYGRYSGAAEGDSPDRLKVLNEALGCLRTTEHYLLMLSSVFEEQDHGAPDRWSPDPAF